MSESVSSDPVGHSADLRTRIAAVIMESCHGVYMDDAVNAADNVIRELDDALLNFGAWLAEEITGRTMTRIDLESCLQEWKRAE